MRKSMSGFTIVELIITIAIIGVLAAITIVAYNGTQAQARDTKRMSDLAAIAEAIQLYRTNYGNDVGVGSGCGSSGNGEGWFNLNNGSSYPKTILSCLTDKGYLDASFIDPTGCVSGSLTYGCPHFYMKYTCSNSDGQTISAVYARQETKDESQKLISQNICSSKYINENFGMNYMVLAN